MSILRWGVEVISLIHNPMFISNIIINGKSKVSGETKHGPQNKLLPFSNVKLFNQQTNEFLLSTYSNRLAEYEFNNLNKDLEYFVVFHDPEKQLNGVIADNIGGGRDMDE